MGLLDLITNFFNNPIVASILTVIWFSSLVYLFFIEKRPLEGEKGNLTSTIIKIIFSIPIGPFVLAILITQSALIYLILTLIWIGLIIFLCSKINLNIPAAIFFGLLFGPFAFIWLIVLYHMKNRLIEDKVYRIIIMGIATSAVATVLLIFIFVGKEAFPIISPQFPKLPFDNYPIEKREEISQIKKEIKSLRKEVNKIKKTFGADSSDSVLSDNPNKDIPENIKNDLNKKEKRVNDLYNKLDVMNENKPFITKINESIESYNENFVEIQKHATLGKLFLKQYWDGEYKFSWAPTNEEEPKFSIWPLLVGSIKATLVAILVGGPLGIAAAVYTSQFANKHIREFIKPIIELLAGIPSVVLGFFALIVLASLIQDTGNAVWSFFHGLTGWEIFKEQLLPNRLNAINAGIALSFAVIPIIYTITEDALNVVPKSYIEASLALGATKFQTTWKVVIPSVLPGMFAALVLGFGRAIGETMIVLMAGGMAATLNWDLTSSIRPIAATIAAEMGEVIQGDTHYTVLFFLGSFLFVITFILNYVGDLVVNHAKKRLSGAK